MSDVLLRGEWPHLNIRVMLLEASEVCELIQTFHQSSGLAREVLNKCIAAGLLTSPLLMEDERFTLRWQYEGELGTILVDVAADGGIRAYPQCLKLREESRAVAFGAGAKLGLVKSNPYRRLNSGMTLADQEDPALDLGTYFELSDQLPTICRVSITNHRVLGLMFQAMPKAHRDHLEQLGPWATTFVHELAQVDLFNPMAVSNWLLKGLQTAGCPAEAWKHHISLKPHHFCNCSTEKIREVLRGLPVEELEAMIREDGGAQLDCQFCARSIRFEASDLQAVIKSKSQDRTT